MLGPIFIFSLLVIVCVGALGRPAIGVIGYYTFVCLEPEWNWRWSLPQDAHFQQYIVIATIAGVLVSGLRGNRWSPASIVACTMLLVFLGLAFVSGQSSILPLETARYLDFMWKIVLMAVIAIHVLDSPSSIVWGLWMVVIAHGYNAYQITVDYLQRGYCVYVYQRSWGYKGDNNTYSIFSVPVMAVSAAIMFGSRPAWHKVIAGVIFTLQLHQIMLFESRGCMLGAAVMLPMFLWYMPKTSLNWSAVVTAALLGAALAGPSVVKEFNSSFAREGERDSSADSRFDLWKAGVRITADYPLLGVGPWAGQRLVPQYIGIPAYVKGLHNLFFEISTGCGIPALFCYLTFFVIAWWIALQGLRRQRHAPLPEWAEITYLATACGMLGYMASSMFSSGALLETSYMLAAFTIATSLIVRREQECTTHVKTDEDEEMTNMKSDISIESSDISPAYMPRLCR